MKCKVLRWVSFGIFSSARIAMYEDINTSRHDFNKNKIITDLFANICDTASFADEYHVDNPQVECEAPFSTNDILNDTPR
jgi:hypothetical protein